MACRLIFFPRLLERGVRRPTVSTLRRLADALSGAPTDLIAGVEKARRAAKR